MPRFFEDELLYLRELGREFARKNVALAPHLAEAATDPDVERLLEGFAFLAGRVREKLEDELPEISQALLKLLWPSYLRPIPSLTILQFEPQAELVKERVRLPRGAEVEAPPIDGIPCRFRTTQAVDVLPLTLQEAVVERPGGEAGYLRLGFRLTQGAAPGALADGRIRLFVHGDPRLSLGLYLLLTRFVSRVTVRGGSRPEAFRGQLDLSGKTIQGGGLTPDEALFDGTPLSLSAHRMLHEYFALREKFLFVDLTGLSMLAPLQGGESFEIIIAFSRAPDPALRPSVENLRLFCTPAANLFTCDADPLRVDHRRLEYLVRPSGVPAEHAAVVSIDGVRGFAMGSAKQREIPDFLSFRHEEQRPGEPQIVYWKEALRESLDGKSYDVYMSFVTRQERQTLPPYETVVPSLTCCHGRLAERVRAGDVTRSCGSTPEVVRFRNITAPTPFVLPPLAGELNWRVIAALSLNQRTYGQVAALRELLSAFDFASVHRQASRRETERRLAGLVAVQVTPDEMIFRGAPVRGVAIELDMNEDNFAGEGDMVLLGSLLREFLALSCTVNSYCRVVVNGKQNGERYEWAPRSGSLCLV